MSSKMEEPAAKRKREDSGTAENTDANKMEEAVIAALKRRQHLRGLHNVSDMFSNLKGRYENVKIVIQGNSTFPKAIRYDLKQAGNEYWFDFEVLHGISEKVPEQLRLDLENKQNGPENRLPMILMKTLLKEAAMRLTYSNAMQCSGKAVEGDPKVISYESPIDPLASPGLYEHNPGSSAENGKSDPGSPEKAPGSSGPKAGCSDADSSEASPHPGRSEEDVVIDQIFCDDFVGVLLKGFENKMSGGSGLEALRMILNYACKIALGSSYAKVGKACVFQLDVSSSEDPFPAIFGDRTAPELPTLAVPPAPPVPGSGQSDASSLIVTIDDDQSSITSEKLDPICGKPDVIVATSMLSPGCRVMIVGNVCSETRISEREVAKMCQQMAAAMYNQEEVFGFLLCPTEARIFRLKPNKKHLAFSEDRYNFCKLLKSTFQTEQLIKMFEDLVAVVYHAYFNGMHNETWPF